MISWVKTTGSIKVLYFRVVLPRPWHSISITVPAKGGSVSKGVRQYTGGGVDHECSGIGRPIPYGGHLNQSRNG